MNLALVYSRAQVGIHAPLVTVEAHISNGLPAFSIVGLPETAVKESRERVRSAILNADFEFPDERITINLAPADLPKAGGRYDLAIALGILAATNQIPAESLQDYEFVAELALSGQIRGVTGILPATLAATEQQRCIVTSKENAEEASLVNNAKHIGISDLQDICQHFTEKKTLSFSAPFSDQEIHIPSSSLDLKDVKGQHQAKRALEIAAAGQHNLLFIGPPGTGKSMLASRLPGLLPPLSTSEKMEVAAIASVTPHTRKNITQLWQQRPFRAPHHTCSGIALVGGGSQPKPGEISLAHHGVLFLDELPEFGRKVLDVLREPLETGEITISRANQSVCYPAQFQLIAAMNPTPKGQLESENPFAPKTAAAKRYIQQISGPLLDRIDLQVSVPKPDQRLLLHSLQSKNEDGASVNQQEESTAVVRKRVEAARNRQHQRQGKCNHQLSAGELATYCSLDKVSQQLLQQSMSQLDLSARAIHRIVKVARTIADLADSSAIQAQHVAEAIGYRQLDRAQ